jgi:hypothetical protein
VALFGHSQAEGAAGRRVPVPGAAIPVAAAQAPAAASAQCGPTVPDLRHSHNGTGFLRPSVGWYAVAAVRRHPDIYQPRNQRTINLRPTGHLLTRRTSLDRLREGIHPARAFALGECVSADFDRVSVQPSASTYADPRGSHCGINSALAAAHTGMPVRATMCRRWERTDAPLRDGAMINHGDHTAPGRT